MTQTQSFFKAVGRGQLEDVKASLPFVDVNAVDRSGKTALIWAAHKGYGEIVDVLLQAGADVDKAEHRHGVTALMLAAHQGHHRIVDALLKAGCRDYYQAMFLAAKQGHADILKQLKTYASREIELV